MDMPSDRPWAVAMNWHDLLFMHWPVAAESIRSLIPSTLEIDTFDQTAWVGVIPFHMTGVRHRRLPQMLASRFPEINVRTYVRLEGRPGVWFFSLDAANWCAVKAARRFYHLPYHHARMTAVNVNGAVRYASRRVSRSGAADAEFAADYNGGETFS